MHRWWLFHEVKAPGPAGKEEEIGQGRERTWCDAERRASLFVWVYWGGATANWSTCGLYEGAGQLWREEKRKKNESGGGNGGERATGRACNGLIWEKGSCRGLCSVDKWWTEWARKIEVKWKKKAEIKSSRYDWHHHKMWKLKGQKQKMMEIHLLHSSKLASTHSNCVSIAPRLGQNLHSTIRNSKTLKLSTLKYC